MTGDEASAQATRDHLDRLVRKRDVLTEAIGEAFDAYATQLARTAPTKAQMVDAWEFAKSVRLPSAAGRLAEAFGVALVDFGRWKRLGKYADDPPLSGPLPLNGHPTPDRGIPCVYLLLDDDRTVLYVGVSETIKERLKTHREAKRIPATNYELIICTSRAEGLRLEGDLIYHHQPPYNTADKKRRRFVA